MAGLAGALALRENGANVTLVERAPEFGEVGAGLQMAPNASRVLKRWGLLEKALEIGVQPKHLVFRDAVTGEELTRQSLGGEFEERYGAPYVVIHRSDLHRVLLEGCEAAGVKLVNDVMVESVETVNGRGVAHTAAGVDYEADVVIGADGLKSTLRPLVANDEPVPSAYVAYRGTVPITEDTPKADLEDVIVYLGPDCHLVQYPLRKGELLNTVAVFKSASFERGEEQYGGVDELEAAYKDCVPAVQDALKNLAHRHPLAHVRPRPDRKLGRRPDGADGRRRPPDAPVPRPGRLPGARRRRRAAGRQQRHRVHRGRRQPGSLGRRHQGVQHRPRRPHRPGPAHRPHLGRILARLRTGPDTAQPALQEPEGQRLPVQRLAVRPGRRRRAGVRAAHSSLADRISA